MTGRADVPGKITMLLMVCCKRGISYVDPSLLYLAALVGRIGINIRCKVQRDYVKYQPNCQKGADYSPQKRHDT